MGPEGQRRGSRHDSLDDGGFGREYGSRAGRTKVIGVEGLPN